MRNGELIASRYELERELGEGGTATVWLARDRTLERPVAIKFLEADDARDRARMTDQFLREARIAAAVRHRNVIQILDFGVHASAPFIVMEALEGESMADRFDHLTPFELREVVEIAARTLEGLSAVHTAGIVHRDLKPENIFLVGDLTGTYPKLLDFGISKAVDKGTGRSSAVPTEAGCVLGTPEYMSPEQARGLTDLDQRTDLYSLGVVMYEALTGQLPYDAPHMGDVLIKVVAGGAAEVAQLVPAVGWPISDVVSKAMHGDRAQRYANALEMRTALLAAAAPLLAGSADPIALPALQGRAARDARASRKTGEGLLPAEVQRAAAAVARHARKSGRRPTGMLIAGAAATILVALGAFAFGGLRGPSRGDSEPRYIVVQGAEAAPPDTAQAAPTQPAAAVPAALPTAPTGGSAAPPQPAAAVPSSPRQRKPRAEPTAETPSAEPAQALARAFEQQKAPVVKCLNQHGDSIAERMQMSVRLALDVQGAVQAVEVLPQPIAATPAGACIADAVRRMRFGAQPGPISIRVPLTAKRTEPAASAP